MGDAVAVEFDIAHSTDWHGRVFGFERGHRTFIDTLQADFQILQRPGLHRSAVPPRRGSRPRWDTDQHPPPPGQGLSRLTPGRPDYPSCAAPSR